MGFEGFQKKSESSKFDALLAQIDKGEIIRGDKGIEDIELGEGVKATIHRETSTLSFNSNNVTTEAIIRDGEIIHLELKNPRTGNSHFDTQLRNQRGEYIKKLIEEGIITL